MREQSAAARAEGLITASATAVAASAKSRRRVISGSFVVSSLLFLRLDRMIMGGFVRRRVDGSVCDHRADRPTAQTHKKAPLQTALYAPVCLV
jgi:hypothetical protein